MKTLLFSSLLILSLFTTTLFSQTALNLGDIAFTGVNFDGSDDFSFVLLKNITTNTTITFNENGWFTIGGFRTGEGTLTWTAGDNLTCGTQVTITGTSSTNNGSFTIGSITGSSLALSGSGDQIFAYQGSKPTAGDESNFITAYQGNGPWDTNATSSNTSAKPSVFTDGVNSISFPVEKDNAAYTNCNVAVGVSTIIYDIANWTQDASNNTPYTLPICSSFACATSCTNPTTPAVTYSPTTTCSDSVVTLSITGTLNDATEWAIYTGSCGGTLEGATLGTTFELSPSVTTTYFVRGEGGCVTPGACTSITVTVTPSDDASFSYSNSTLCQSATDPTPTITGLAGGSFTSSPTGLVINSATGEIDLSASATNIYGITYTTSGPCTNSSIEYITVVGATIGYDVIAACDTYTWIDGITYTTSNNTATYLLTNANGCDSTATLNLTIHNSDNTIDNQTACMTYTWIDGNTYTSDNNLATHTLTNTNGCDSIVTLNLVITQPNTGIDNQTACNSFTWIDGNSYSTNNNSATHTLTNISGCDSVVTLNLTIVTTLTSIDTQAACDSYIWIDGNTYTTSNNTATHTLTSIAGCDSIITLDLTINNSNTGVDTQTACDSYSWIDGNTYTTSNNTATHTLTNIVGCDSVITLDLTINNSSTGTDTQIACDSYTWIDGNTYTTSNNIATHTLPNINGCDSIITLNLTINNSTIGTDTQTACNSFTWIDGNTYTSSNTTATHTLPNVNGCDSVVTLNLIIVTTLTSTDTQTACDSYTWIDGNTYTSNNNTATHTLTSTQGCDSIVTLDLTINNSSTGIDTQTACNSYTWIDGNTYTTSNNSATYTLSNVNGCDSVVTLNLTINASNTGVDTQIACDSYTWIDGNTYTSNNTTATYTLSNINGCDSIVTLDLIINNSNTGVDSQIACDSYTWIDGNTYTTSNNTAVHTLTNINGCDSIVTLNLTINASSTFSQTATICGSEVFIVGNSSYSTSGTYTDVLTTANGCDSTVTTNLTVETSIDTYVERLNAVFTVNSTSGATYQWLDCDNGNAPIAGETSTVFTATTEGNYAVAVTIGNCSDTSICNELPYIVGMIDNKENSISVYPNPTENNITIILNESYNNASLTIVDVMGKIVYSQTIQDQLKLNLSTEQFENGIYFIKLQAKNKSETIQLIKQ